MKESLTPGEALILEQLVELAGGIGFMKFRALLNDTQAAALPDLKHKGYVMLTHDKFLVIATAVPSQDPPGGPQHPSNLS